jgi:hypothetical protein
VRRTDRKPSIFVEKIVIGKTPQPPGSELVLPAGTHHVELHFDSIELASPETIRLQYRLDGVDREWLDADSTATAIYSGLPLGAHAFHVRACNRDGVWDRTGIVYTITQQPYFYQTAWFAGACGMAIIGILGLSSRRESGSVWKRERRREYGSRAISTTHSYRAFKA